LIASIDGAIILDKNLNILSFGEIILESKNKENITSNADKLIFGARTTAAKEASFSGIAIKISEDSDIELFKNGEKILWL
jgi:DNA integrity scanning protein DisA with diadenylate cyclase activity